MKALYILIALMIVACNPTEKAGNTTTSDTVRSYRSDSVSKQDENKKPDTLAKHPAFSNEHFREVTVKKIGDRKFMVTGQARIFEANFGWFVKDGSEELQQGHQMADAGAPAWGNFSFTLGVDKQEASGLTLVLFESSAKDGSRQFELQIPLPN